MNPIDDEGLSYRVCVKCDANEGMTCCDYIQRGWCYLLPPEEDEEGTSMECHNWDWCENCELYYHVPNDYYKPRKLCPVVRDYLKGRF